MTSPVRLSEFVSLLQSVDFDTAIAVDKGTGSVRPVEPAAAQGSDEERFPAMTERGEAELAKAFSAKIENAADQHRLRLALSSADPLDAFQNALYRSKIAHEWFQFRDAQLVRLAKEWLDARGLPYVDDIDVIQ